jgi:hypothetical protein
MLKIDFNYEILYEGLEVGVIVESILQSRGSTKKTCK